MRFKSSLRVIFFCVMVFTSCNKANFSVGTQPRVVAKPGGNNTPPQALPPTTKPPAPIETVINKLTPSFVTRSHGCIMCHADIKGGVFLDFGYDPSENNKLFLGGANDILPPLLNGEKPPSSIYGGPVSPNNIYLARSPYFSWHTSVYALGWMGLPNSKPPEKDKEKEPRIFGTLYIPDVAFKKEDYPGLFSIYLKNENTSLNSISLAALLNTPLYVNPAAIANNKPPGWPMSKIVTPPNAGDAPVVVLKELKIGAPTSDDIRALITGKPCSPTEGCIFPITSHESVGGFQGITNIARPVNPPITNGCTSADVPKPNAYSNMVVNAQGAISTSEIRCSGDVVIVGSLFLKNPSIKTDADGCRFYVDGNVWIDGEHINYVGDTGASHLQITSSGNIVFGLYNVSGNPNNRSSSPAGSLLRRILPDGADLAWSMVVRRATTSLDKTVNYKALESFLTSVLCDGTYAPSNFFTNPPDKPGMKDIKKVVLNAPIIQGYFTDSADMVADPRIITGIVISETSLFGGNNFSFKFAFDPIFKDNKKFFLFPAFPDEVRNRIFYAVEK